jgi:hypothetical protein
MTAPGALPTLVVPRIARKIRVDADLVKAPWSELAPIALVPSHGRAAPPGFQPTALRVCHDGERLSIAFGAADAHVFGTHRGRNAPIYEEEVVEAFLAPDGDPRRYFELEASPFGAWFEARIENPDGRRATMRSDRDWVCAGWERAVRIHASGWDVEWAIPFAALAAPPPAPGAAWRANFFRIDQANGGEYSAWSPTFADPPDFHVPARFGVLRFG